MLATINNIKIVIFILDRIIYFPNVKIEKKLYIRLNGVFRISYQERQGCLYI